MNYRKNIACVFFICSVAFFSCAQQKELPVKKKYKGIERSLYLLNSSTKDNPQNFDILFYGQSIIGGMKTNILVDSLQKRFPFTTITYKHKPIGGFTLPNLIKTANHDVYQENPDLIIFHAYGGIKDGLYDELILNFRQRMTADVLLLDHHHVWNKPESKLKSINKSHEFDSKVIKSIAEKYDCGFVDVRDQWKLYIQKNAITPNELMGNTIDSNVHPNDEGNALLREIVLSKFPVQNQLEYDIGNDSLRHSIIYDNSIKDSTVAFTGNRVSLSAKSITEEVILEIQIDGKKLSEFRSSYHISRPSKGYGTWMPAIRTLSLGSTFPQEENWTITLHDINRKAKTFEFTIEGSLTGFDGVGNSETDFISDSKRIKLLKEEFYIFEIEKIFKNKTPEGFKITFDVKQIVRDRVVLKDRFMSHMIFRGNAVDKHSLNIKFTKGNLEDIELMIFKPYVSTP